MIISSNFVLGTLFLVLGASIIIKVLTGVNIPIFKFLLAGFLIYLGFSIMTGTFTKKKYKSWYWSYSSPTTSDYSVAFGSRVIDLSDKKPTPDNPEHLNLNVFASAATVFINSAVPTQVIVNVSMGRVSLPDTNSTAIGSYTYRNYPADERAALYLTVNAAFSRVDVVSKNLP